MFCEVFATDEFPNIIMNELFKNSVVNGTSPTILKLAKIIPSHKSGDVT